jgi:hypothetical protein
MWNWIGAYNWAGDRTEFLPIGDGVLAKECENSIRVNKLTNVSQIPQCTVAEVYPLLSGLVLAVWDDFVRFLPTYGAHVLKAALLIRVRFSRPAIAAQYRNSFKTAVAQFRVAPEDSTATTNAVCLNG